MLMLYHYCTLETFLKIIQKKRIRFSDITKSNDIREIEYLWEHYIAYVNAHSTNPGAKATLRYFRDEQMLRTLFLVSCFSGLRNSSLMWSRYGNGGVRIEYNKDKLSKWINQLDMGDIGGGKNQYCNLKPRLNKVKYYPKESVDNQVREMCEGIQFVTDPFPCVFDNAPFIKTDFWEEEQEWRIVIPVLFDDAVKGSIVDNTPENTTTPIEISAESKGRFPLCISCDVPFDPEMIEGIMLAPNCAAEISDVEKVLLANGFDHLIGKVCVSHGSLRR